ncbi:MAG: twin-arginine translocation signal domain-containing protein, partial [Candidatus Methylomirabilales bacterium]
MNTEHKQPANNQEATTSISRRDVLKGLAAAAASATGIACSRESSDAEKAPPPQAAAPAAGALV